MTLLKLLFGFAPAMLAWTMAASSSIAYQELPEENRRLIERETERLHGVERLHETDVAAIREVVELHQELIELHQEQISQRLEAIENYLFWLFVTGGGVGTLVGADTARYWLQKKRSDA